MVGIQGIAAKRLLAAVADADARLRPYRINRLAMLRQYAGPHYGSAAGSGAGTGSAEPLNVLFSVVSTLLPHLAVHNPRAMITPRRDLRPTADRFAREWNVLARQIDLGRTLRRLAADALFAAGIVKVGLARGPGATPLPSAAWACADGHAQSPSAGGPADNARAWHPDAPHVFADPVDLDNYVIDPTCRVREHAAFEGNRYLMPRSALLAEPGVNSAVVEKLPAASGQHGDPRAAELSGRAGGELRGDWLELIDLYLPAEGVVVTLPARGEADAFCREAAWEGPDGGPYEMLGFHWVPDNPMPVGLLGVVFDLHVMVNKVARKLARQADRQKDLVLFDDSAGDEATRVRDAADGEMVGVQNVDRYRQVSFGGGSDGGYEHLAFLQDQLARLVGNVDLLGGLAPQSQTVGQDRMLFANASSRIEDMRQQLNAFARRVGERLAWYLWHDPVGRHLALGTGHLAPEPPSDVHLRSDAKCQVPNAKCLQSPLQGDWLDLDFDIEPHSMLADDPGQRFARTVQWIERVVLPTAELGRRQGREIDAARLAAVAAGLLQLPEAAGLYQPADVEDRS